MSTPVVTVASGGLAVIDVTSTTPKLGLPVTEALRGTAVTKVLANGLPVTFTSASGPGTAGNLRFGVNMSGPEFAPWNGQVFPSAANWTYLAGLGCTFVRLPIAWESLQTSFGAALNATYLGNIQAAIAAAKAAGIGTLVDLHNFGCYAAQAQWTTTVPYAGNGGTFPATGVSTLGSGITSANFTDVWTKLATALLGTNGLIGYGLMNEPVNTVGTNKILSPNYFLATPLNPWGVTNACVATIQAAGTNPLGAGYGPAWQITSGSGFGSVQQPIVLTAVPHTVSVYAKTASGTQPLQLTNDGAVVGSASATTTWTRYSGTFTPTAASHNIGFQLNAGSGNSMLIANAQLETGAAPTAYAPSPYTSFAQAAVNAIRAVDATTPIYICGAGQTLASCWPQYNYEMASMTGGGLIFEAHQYFDGQQAWGSGGGYAGTFTSYGVDTATGVQAATKFTDWMAATGAAGFMGEFGVPNNVVDNNAQWLPTQVNFLNALKTANCKGTQWFYGSNGIIPANALNLATTVNDPRLTQMLAVS